MTQINSLGFFKNFPTNVINTATVLYAGAHVITIGCGLACAVAAANLFCRAVFDPKGDRSFVSGTLGGAAFFALCASNALPGLPILGGVSLLVLSACIGHEKDSYLITQAIYQGTKLVWKVVSTIFEAFFNATSRAARFLRDWIIMPIWNNVFAPIFNAILECMYAVGRALALVWNPVWTPVAALLTVIIVGRVVLPMLGINLF